MKSFIHQQHPPSRIARLAVRRASERASARAHLPLIFNYSLIYYDRPRGIGSVTFRAVADRFDSLRCSRGEPIQTHSLCNIVQRSIDTPMSSP